MDDNQAKCKFCSRPAWTGNVVSPPMCLMHLDLMMLVLRVQRRKQTVTAQAVKNVYREMPVEARAQLAIKLEGIGPLLRQMRAAGLFDDNQPAEVWVGKNGDKR